MKIRKPIFCENPSFSRWELPKTLPQFFCRRWGVSHTNSSHLAGHIFCVNTYIEEGVMKWTVKYSFKPKKCYFSFRTITLPSNMKRVGLFANMYVGIVSSCIRMYIEGEEYLNMYACLMSMYHSVSCLESDHIFDQF